MAEKEVFNPTKNEWWDAHPEAKEVARKRMLGKKRPRHSEAMKGDKNPMKRPEVAEKNKLARIKYYREHPEAREESRRWSLEYYENHPEHNKGKNNPMYGKKRPELTEKFIGEGNPMYGRRGPLNPFYGKHHTQKAKDAVSKANKGRFEGDKNPAWKGGLSFEPYLPEFNEELKERIRNKYGRVCYLCVRSEKENKEKLSIHHIDYNKKNNEEENLIPLCRSCNSKVNNDREFWLFYFLEMFRIEEEED